VLLPFVELLERTSTDWLRQRDQPLGDEPLMHLVLDDMYRSLSAHQDALQGLALARGELGDDVIERVRVAFDDLVRQLRLMAELEAERREWFSPIGLDLTLRVLMAMVLGTTAYDWILLPEDRPDAESLVDEMSKVALWGLARQPPGAGRG
jgi:hypothetical protein